ETGEPLIQRDDDREETVRHRLGIYHEQTSRLIDYYRGEQANGTRYHGIDGVGTVDEIRTRVLQALA
ncbi:MAG TPA: adenylate kinase, partial [Pseudomonadales bacterium]|nr:adenylate kinase [Pseudomonadales bacterium]